MAIATPPSASQELRADACSVSAAVFGRPTIISTDYTAVGDVTTLHAMTQADVVDKVWLTFWNIDSTLTVGIALIINPNDDGVVGDVDAATVNIRVPPRRPLVLDPLFVRFDPGGNAYTIAAYAVLTAEINLVKVTSRYVRLTQGVLTA